MLWASLSELYQLISYIDAVRQRRNSYVLGTVDSLPVWASQNLYVVGGCMASVAATERHSAPTLYGNLFEISVDNLGHEAHDELAQINATVQNTGIFSTTFSTRTHQWVAVFHQ